MVILVVDASKFLSGAGTHVNDPYAEKCCN